ncbi:hypothetical protein [Methylobacterium nonmethylotrophicum]|uniref:hypothetical protein n=1 Tax=Methylobacterium nonmethylotrophicum TaxID=1141884 RepID=UPI001FE04730|nr:hypothetical protein [Methylobacterium nonmethylotrophicum]
MDQHLHRHVHDLLPTAQRLLSAREIDEAATAFVRARGQALRSGGRSRPGATGPSEIALVAAVGLAAFGAGLLAWRFGLLRGSPERGWGDRGLARGRPRADLAAASAPGRRRPGDNLAERQDRLLDEAIEETFPASDPISPHQITR